MLAATARVGRTGVHRFFTAGPSTSVGRGRCNRRSADRCPRWSRCPGGAAVLRLHIGEVRRTVADDVYALAPYARTLGVEFGELRAETPVSAHLAYRPELSTTNGGLHGGALMGLGAGRIAAMDAQGIDVSILAVTPAGTHPLSPEDALRHSYAATDLAATAARDASYRGFGPMTDLALATYGWGWHLDAATAALRLILRGTFDRHPDLQVVLGHWGEKLLFWLDRADGLSRVAGRDRDLPGPLRFRRRPSDVLIGQRHIAVRHRHLTDQPILGMKRRPVWMPRGRPGAAGRSARRLVRP